MEMKMMKKGEMLSKAILIATLAHEGQFDKGGNPYILHPLTVLHKLKSKDEDEQAAAVLHDVIEDKTGKTIKMPEGDMVISYQMLREAGISERTIEIVRLLTKVPGQTEDEYQAGVLTDVSAMKVKREDLRTNSDLRRLKGVTEKDLARMAKYQMFYFEIEQKLNADTAN
jgi:hypothetical protein